MLHAPLLCLRDRYKCNIHSRADRGVGGKLGRAENVRRRFPLAPVCRPPHDLPLGLRGCNETSTRILLSQWNRLNTFYRKTYGKWANGKRRLACLVAVSRHLHQLPLPPSPYPVHYHPPPVPPRLRLCFPMFATHGVCAVAAWVATHREPIRKQTSDSCYATPLFWDAHRMFTECLPSAYRVSNACLPSADWVPTECLPSDYRVSTECPPSVYRVLTCCVRPG